MSTTSASSTAERFEPDAERATEDGKRASLGAKRPTIDAERRAWDAGRRHVAGLDEVGRGALAGPVVAAAVVLPRDEPSILDDLAGVRDSKQLAPAARCRLYAHIVARAAAFGIGAASPLTVDVLGIVRATELAMLRALAALPRQADHLLVDGVPLRLLQLPQEAIFGGDRQVLSIAAASVVAKVYRDALMVALGAQLPEYGFDSHKGYATATHRDAIRAHGLTAHHRLTWAPLRAAPRPQPGHGWQLRLPWDTGAIGSTAMARPGAADGIGVGSPGIASARSGPLDAAAGGNG